MATEKEQETPILHVIVVGFHHKKGCQVEYSYPPVIAGNAVDSQDLPQEWKHLPSLALPDGAHNFLKDTVFFHLPGRDFAQKTVYCVSCYRQMDAKDLLNRTADITRSTVQKSVCVISRLPLYGLIKAKLELITHAYFDERDFSKVELLEQTFNNLNTSLADSLFSGAQMFLGLSVRDAVKRFKHKLVVLFKLIMLERRVLFFGSPVETLGSSLLSVLSLFPGMLEFGLEQSVSLGGQRLVSPTLGVASLDSADNCTGEEFLEVRYHESPPEDSSSILSEVISHMHTFSTASTSEAPESPTIPRDITRDFTGSSSSEFEDVSSLKAQKEAENEQLKVSDIKQSLADSCVLQQQKSSQVHSTTRPDLRLEVHKATSHHLDVSKMSAITMAKLSPTHDDTSGTLLRSLLNKPDCDTNANTVVSSDEQCPLTDVSALTQICAVQMSQTVSHDYAAKNSNTDSARLEEDAAKLALSVNMSDTLLGRSSSVEELDSPESLYNIDREDCFSWEEDRLQLALSMEGDDCVSTDLLHTYSNSIQQQLPDQGSSIITEQDLMHIEASLTEHDFQSSSSSTHSSTPNSTPPTKGSPASHKKSKQGSPGKRGAALKNKLSTAFSKVGSRNKGKEQGAIEMKPVIKGEVRLQQDEFGFPLAIFTKGCICHPYLSLQYHFILNDINVRSFVIGATNILFKQQRQATDVIVLVEDGKLEVKDRELQKHLHLTTADLRFADYLIRVVTEAMDGTEWEGSDEWIRAQFRVYLQSLLTSMQNEDAKLLDDFGLPFVSAWRTTHNYRHWLETAPHPKMAEIIPGHPFQGNLSVNDVKMRLNHSMQSTERGRKFNAAVAQTGKYVLQTGKAVGGAFSSARSAVSSWFNSITNDWKHSEEEEDVDDGSGEKSNNF